jgi:hypothetical protein
VLQLINKFLNHLNKYHLTIFQKRALIATSSIVGDYDNKTATKTTSTRQQQIVSAPRVAKPKESQ